MKNLKNYISAGLIGLGSLGIFGNEGYGQEKQDNSKVYQNIKETIKIIESRLGEVNITYLDKYDPELGKIDSVLGIKDTLTPLQKYNLENKQIYEDFKDFMEMKGISPSDNFSNYYRDIKYSMN